MPRSTNHERMASLDASEVPLKPERFANEARMASRTHIGNTASTTVPKPMRYFSRSFVAWNAAAFRTVMAASPLSSSKPEDRSMAVEAVAMAAMRMRLISCS